MNVRDANAELLSVLLISGLLAPLVLTDLSVLKILKQNLFSPVFLVVLGRKAHNLLMYNKLIHHYQKQTFPKFSIFSVTGLNLRQTNHKGILMVNVA